MSSASRGGAGPPESGRGAPEIYWGSDLAGGRGRRSFCVKLGSHPQLELWPLLHLVSRPASGMRPPVARRAADVILSITCDEMSEAAPALRGRPFRLPPLKMGLSICREGGLARYLSQKVDQNQQEEFSRYSGPRATRPTRALTWSRRRRNITITYRKCVTSDG